MEPVPADRSPGMPLDIHMDIHHRIRRFPASAKRMKASPRDVDKVTPEVRLKFHENCEKIENLIRTTIPFFA